MTTTTALQYYTFNNTDRIGAEFTDNTMKTISNDRYMTHMLSNFHDKSNKSYVEFATQQPIVTFSANSHGNGLNGEVVDIDSQLLIKTSNERSLEKLNLFQRPFLTIPYLGKSLGDPIIESQLQQGEVVNEKKSISTIMDKSFLEYSLYVTNEDMNDRVQNPSKNVEEYALEGWIRGGSNSRNN